MQRRYWRFALIATGIVFALIASSMPQSFAHPVYVRSTPQAFQTVAAPPSAVNVFFTEPIELKYSKISVIGPDGNRIDNDDPHNVDGDTASLGVSLKPGLPDGTYTVSTKVLSAVDGHSVDNAFTFGVGLATTLSGHAAQEQTQNLLSIPEVGSRYPGIVGQVMIVGGAFASLWLWKPISRVPWLSEAVAQKKVAIDKTMVKFVMVGVVLVLASSVAMIVVQAYSIGGSIPDAIATKFGNVWISRMLQSAILAVIVFSVYRKVVKKNSSLRRSETLAILILGMAILVTSSLIAHAAATSQITTIALDFFHDVAAAIWIGGLMLLGFVAAPKILEIADERVKATAVSLLIPRFSIIVVTILGIVAITGPLLLYSIENDLSLVVASIYGKFLIAKLSLAGVMLGMGAYSQFAIQKNAVSVIDSSGAGKRGGTSMMQTRGPNLKHFSKFLKIEAAVGIGLLLMVSFMANSSVPSGQFPAYENQRQLATTAAAAGGGQTNGTTGQTSPLNTDFSQTIYVGDEGKIQLQISPFDVGQNNFKISFIGVDGKPVSSIQSATIKMTQTEKAIGPITLDTKKESDGIFNSTGGFGVAGKWSVIIEGVNSQGNNMIASLDLNVKPQVSNLDFTIKQYKTPTASMPLFPVFDANRQSIWVGDTTLGSARIWQFNIDTGNYTAHGIKGANIVTQMVLAPDGNLWYIDPLAAQPNSTLGVYDPNTNSTRQFLLPVEGVGTGIAIDNSGNLWIPISQANKVVKFVPQTQQLTQYDIPTAEAEPVGIISDSQGNIWFTEAIGKIAKIDINSGKITEYAPKSVEQGLGEPTAIFEDPNNPGTLYISDHTNHTISAFNTLLGTFRTYPSLDQSGLPFGMAMDSFGNLWVAEHTIDKMAVMDPRTGASNEVNIPITGSFIQWITSDNDGRIWFAAQRGDGLGNITVTAKPSSSLPPSTSSSNEGQQEAGASTGGGGIPQLGFSFATAAGPGIAAGIVMSALFYVKSSTDLNRNVRTALKQKP
ncbi:MAG: copper resistance protein CopC [Nitrososphaera sp.]